MGPMTTGKKILLVEDDEALRQSLTEQLLLHEEFTTVAAESGAEALALTKDDHLPRQSPPAL